MNEFAPSMPGVKAVGDWFNRTFAGRNNIRECFLLEWAASALGVASQTDPKDEKLLRERLKEAKVAIAGVAGLLCDEIEGKLTPNEMERLRRVSGTKELALIDVLRAGIKGESKEDYDLFLALLQTNQCKVNTLAGPSNRLGALEHAVRAFVYFEALEQRFNSYNLERVEEGIARAHVALRPNGESFNLSKVLARMTNEARGLRSQIAMASIATAEEEILTEP